MINSETFKSAYIVVAGRADYPIGFVYFMNVADNTPQIIVYLNKVYTSPLVYGVDYTLSADGLSIVLTSPVAGDSLEIFRDVPFTQLSDYVIGRIDPDQIERDFDLAVMRAQQAESEITRISEMPEDHEARIEELEYDVDNLESLVPAQATDLNQLADKDFVNSSIATSTATFRGTYSSLADLEAVTADDNDYGYVESVDSVGNTLYNRYKYTTSTTPASWVFEYALNNSSFTAAQWAAINSGITSTIVEHLDVPTGRNVGDVFWTMRTDSSLNGAVECNGAQYSISDFSGGESIGVLLENNKVPYVSLSDYATALAADGSVGVFGWDGAGTSAFRVPSLNDVFIETGTAAQIGDYIPAGVPNITAELDCILGPQGETINKTGAFTETVVNNGNGYNRSWIDGSAFMKRVDVKIDASDSDSVYGAANTVQPKAVRYRAMVQLFVSATDEAVATCTAITAQVGTNTSDITGLKAHEVIEFQAPTAQNNYTWYRKYADGWVEQGGYHAFGAGRSSTAEVVNLPIEMQDTNYSVYLQIKSSAHNYQNGSGPVLLSQAVTTISVQMNDEGSAVLDGFCWEIKGMYV